MKDLVYMYDKVDFTRSEFGEIQRDFNLSFVIDGTKDSAKVMVINHSGVEVEPYSIVKHRATNTWWVVSHDKVTRYANDNNTYLYTHELELLGAIELLNSRDLTDSGFNQNRYNIGQFFDRVLKHSNFEFKSAYTLDPQDNINLNKNIDYVKTFENYTPLSAIREFIDGYNCAIKLDFVENSSGTITSANFYIVSKSGNINGTTWNESDFNEVQETKTLDKNSFGTSVISNAENVISTKAKTYPSTGAVKFTGTANTIKGSNGTAVIRLPSSAFRVNWVDMYKKITINCYYNPSAGNDATAKYTFYGYNDKSIETAYNRVLNFFANHNLSSTDFQNTFPMGRMKEYGKRRFYYTDKYDPVADKFYSDYYIPIRVPQNFTPERQTVLSNSEMKQNVNQPDDVFSFERGKDLINNFTFFGDTGAGLNKAYFRTTTEGTVYSDNIPAYGTIIVSVGDLSSGSDYSVDSQQEFELSTIGCVINYVPMSDIKIKVDNQGDKRDSQLFNQNGKLTDSVALSKRLLSYSKEIESDTITKYGAFYVKNENGTITNNIPKVGDLVSIGNDIYVINNVALDFFENDVNDTNTDINYYVRAEFTMSKNVAVKSLMVNPSQNIRDYGIPQNNNVKRKQLYRDFYELGHSQESSDTTWYQPLPSVLNISNQYDPYQEHIALIKLSFNGAYGGGLSKDDIGGTDIDIDPSSVWYYQLESTAYVMKKMVYEVIDFKDNNIIGYGSQNVWSGFNIKRIIFGNLDYTNTPISYVDNNGEVKDITLLLCTNDKLAEIYNDYISASGSGSSNYGAFYSCFIPKQIYEGGVVYDQSTPPISTTITGAIDKKDFAIIELDYEKDALEVPVFEYVCQIDDSNEVVVGDNILDTYQEDNAYLYSYVFVNKNKYNNNNYGNASIGSVSIDSNNVATLINAVKLEYSGNSQVNITLYNSVSYDLESGTATYGTQQAFDTTKDLMIIRHRILEEDLFRDVIGELISTTIYSDLPSAISSYYNKYAIKTDDNYYECQITTVASSGTLYSWNVATSYTNLQTYQGVIGQVMACKEIAEDTAYVSMTHDNTTITYTLGGNTYSDTLTQAVVTYTYSIAEHWQTIATITKNFYDTGTYNYVTYTNNNYTFTSSNDVDVDLLTVYDTGGNTYSGSITNVVILDTHNIQIEFTVNTEGYANILYARFRIMYKVSASTGNTRTITLTGTRNIGQQTYTVDNPSYETITLINTIDTTILEVYHSDYYLYICTGNYAWDSSTRTLLSTLTSNKYEYNGLYYQWNGSSWVDVTTYQWTSIASANNEYFTYNGTLYQYNATTNVLEQISSDTDINREDLMLIVRDMDNANITSNELSLYINYYKTN